MLDGLSDDVVDRYLEQHPKIVSLFEVDVVEAVTLYIMHREDELDEPDREAVRELRQARESLEQELAISQKVKASHLEEVNLGTNEAPKPVNVAKELPREEKMAMIELLKEF